MTEIGQGHPRLRVDHFKALCIAHKMRTPAETARGLGIHPSTLSKVMRGQRQPGGEFIHRVMKKLRCGYFEIFEDNEKETT